MNPPYFRSPWSSRLKITTSVFLVLLTFGMIFTGGVGTILCASLILLSLLLMVNGYSVQNGNLIVHGLLWRKAFDLRELETIWVEPFITEGSVRTFGIGGFFSSIGYFNNPVLGNYLGFMTNGQNSVILDFVRRRVVVTPDDPPAFRKAVMAEYRRIHV